MPSKPVHTKVGERKLKLTNLDKILYPDAEISKAEIIQYFLTVAPKMLEFVGGRPLSFVRYPDGIAKHKFFQKDRPSWTPEWINSINISKEADDKNYLYADEEADLVWMANMACLELHCMQVHVSQPHNPDFFVFDLDPPDAKDFESVKQLAFNLKPFLESYGYHAFIKTSGGKGLHIVCPIHPNYPIEDVIVAVKELANAFQKQHPKTTTLHLKKEARKGRLLLDIYRNHKGQTTAAALSTRGKPNAPVSMPISWEHLKEVEAANQYHIRNAVDFINENGIAWEGWRNYAVELHTKRKEKVKAKETKSTKKKVAVKKELLEEYEAKRDFDKTTEPSPAATVEDSNQFVVHLHNASNLHFDLRLQAEGVLHSWAIPKGLPHEKGVKRLAIQTEPHPVKYLDFEGTIPKNEYGGGEMWVFSRGTYETVKRKDSKWEFKLKSKTLNATYYIYKIKNDEWLIERKDEQLKNILDNIPKPMLADVSKKIIDSEEFVYEIKWDGIRVLIVIDETGLKIISRSGRDITTQFPELTKDKKYLKATAGIFDGEIVCLDEQGRPDFAKVISRMHSTGEKSILSKSKSNPAYCYLFDCIYFGGRDISKEPLLKRQEWLSVILKKGSHYRQSEAVEDGLELYEAAKAMELEGVMMKLKTGKYEFGKRTNYWQKVKFRNTADYEIVGYTNGEGDRSKLFGALHLIEREGEKIIYRGKVGSGFDETKMKAILKLIIKQGEDKKIFKDKIEEARRSHWIKPGLVCEIQYASMTKNGTLREPVFIRMREDLFFN